MTVDLLTQLNENRRKVDFDTFDITVKELISMVADSVINIAPEYQRQFRWTQAGQSTFIESVFLGIPIPSLFMAANSDGTWELIDGVQRLSTLIHFMGDENIRGIISQKEPLKLNELKKISAFNGKTFEELPKTIQLQFSLKALKVTTISDKSDFNVRFDLFERLNTGGVKLEHQEIRSCIYRGEFNEKLRDLSRQESFSKVVKFDRNSEKDGTKEEFVLRFFAFFYSYQEFEHSVVDFLNNYTAEASKKFDYSFNEKLFTVVFQKLSEALPKGLTRGKKRVTAANLYEAVTVGAALAYQETGKIITTGVEEWIISEELKKLTTGGTNTRKMVKERIKYCRNKFMEL